MLGKKLLPAGDLGQWHKRLPCECNPWYQKVKFVQHFYTLIQRKFYLSHCLFTSSVEELPPDFHLEGINLQCSDILQYRHRKKTQFCDCVISI